MYSNYISDFSPLSYLSNLKKFTIEKINLNCLNQIKGLIKIENLNLFGNKDLTDISLLSNLVNIKKLNLAETKINNIKGIESMIKLEELNLENDDDVSDKDKLTDISPLSNLVNLRKLNLSWQNIIDTKSIII